MPAWAPPAWHVLDAAARLLGRGAGSDMNEAFIQEPERPGASLKDAGTQKRAPGARTGADGPCGSCLSSFLRAVPVLTTLGSLHTSVLLRREAISCPPCTLGSGRGSELPREEVSLLQSVAACPGLSGARGSRGHRWLKAVDSRGCLRPGARVKKQNKTGKPCLCCPSWKDTTFMCGSCHLCKKDSESRKGRVTSKGD